MLVPVKQCMKSTHRVEVIWDNIPIFTDMSMGQKSTNTLIIDIIFNEYLLGNYLFKQQEV